MNTKVKENKGITLIALVVTIIVLIILAGITLNILIGEDGILKRSKEVKPIQDVATAKEQLELLKALIYVDEHEVTLSNYITKLTDEAEKYKASDIKELNDGINATVLIDGRYKFLIHDKKNGDVEIIPQGEASGLLLSETSGTMIHPNTLIFEIRYNESGGELTVESENENIATAEINGEIVTVTSQGVAGTVRIIVRSAANNGLAEGIATYEATVENGTIEIEATTYQGIYDGQAHDAVTSVTVNPTDATLKYTLKQGDTVITQDSPTIPQITEAGTYTVSITASKAGYATKAQTITTPAKIDKAPTTSEYLELSKTSETITYPTADTFTVSKNTSGGILSVESSNPEIATASIDRDTKIVTVTPQVLTEDEQKVTITVISEATSNYEEQTATYTATVNRGTITISGTPYTGTYDGQAHDALTSVSTTPTGTTLKYALKQGETVIAQDSTTMPQITNAGTYTITVTASKEGYVTKTTTITTSAEIGQQGTGNITVTLGTTTYTYDGAAKKPTVTVKDGSKTLTSGTDYTVAYSNNTNAGTGKATVTLKGNYTGTVDKTFTINPGTITISATPYTGTYDGTAHVALSNVSTTPTGTTITYSLNGGTASATVPTVTGATSYTVVVTASKTNYTTKTEIYTVTVGQKALTNCTITLGTTTYTYDGTAKTPTVTVKDGTKTLTKDTDYTVAYSNNTNAGTATVTVTGKGNYTGMKQGTFTIKCSGTTYYCESQKETKQCSGGYTTYYFRCSKCGTEVSSLTNSLSGKSCSNRSCSGTYSLRMALNTKCSHNEYDPHTYEVDGKCIHGKTSPHYYCDHNSNGVEHQ